MPFPGLAVDADLIMRDDLHLVPAVREPADAAVVMVAMPRMIAFDLGTIGCIPRVEKRWIRESSSSTGSRSRSFPSISVSSSGNAPKLPARRSRR